MSSPPNSSRAWSTTPSAPSRSATLFGLATATPPAARISATTSSAGPLDAPVPSTSMPRSFTTTLAPREARSWAWARPIPRPAPVTTATLPSNLSSPMVPRSFPAGPERQASLDEEAGVDRQDDAGHVAGGVTGQPHHRLADVGGLDHLHRHGVRQAAGHPGGCEDHGERLVDGHGGVDPGGRDDVDPDAVLGQRVGVVVHEADHPVLGR